jgi:hypothetical protein
MSHWPGALATAVGIPAGLVSALESGLGGWSAAGAVLAVFGLWAGTQVVTRYFGAEARAGDMAESLSRAGLAGKDIAMVLSAWAPNQRTPPGP